MPQLFQQNITQVRKGIAIFCSQFTLLFQMLLSKNEWKETFEKNLSVFALNCLFWTVAAFLRPESCTA